MKSGFLGNQTASCRYCWQPFTFRWESEYRDECPACVVKHAVLASLPANERPVQFAANVRRSREQINRALGSWVSPEQAAQRIVQELDQRRL